jgi:hypothetical protein
VRVSRHVVSIGLLAAVTGCAGSSTTPPAGRDTHGQSPAPGRTVVSTAHVHPAGEAAVIRAQAGVALRLRASKPRVSRTSLSSSYGYPPQHGYYLTFRIVAVNTGRRTISLGPRDFSLRIPGRGRVTSYDGNSPYSGAAAQLDATELEAGQRVAAPLTFDVGHRHGRLAFAPDGSPAAVWTY